MMARAIPVRRRQRRKRARGAEAAEGDWYSPSLDASKGDVRKARYRRWENLYSRRSWPGSDRIGGDPQPSKMGVPALHSHRETGQARDTI